MPLARTDPAAPAARRRGRSPGWPAPWSASLADAERLRPERGAHGVQQVGERAVDRPLPGGATRGAHPPQVGEIRLDRRHHRLVRHRHRTRFPARLRDCAGVRAAVMDAIPHHKPRLPVLVFRATPKAGHHPASSRPGARFGRRFDVAHSAGAENHLVPIRFFPFHPTASIYPRGRCSVPEAIRAGSFSAGSSLSACTALEAAL